MGVARTQFVAVIFCKHENVPCLENFPILFALTLATSIAKAETIGCVTTVWKLISANPKVCVEAFRDPSKFSLPCRQTLPVMPWGGR